MISTFIVWRIVNSQQPTSSLQPLLTSNFQAVNRWRLGVGSGLGVGSWKLAIEVLSLQPGQQCALEEIEQVLLADLIW